MFDTATERRIVDEYISGSSLGELASARSTNRTTIHNVLKRSGVERRAQNVTRTGIRVRHDAFSTLTREANYWAGFLLADGCIRDPRGQARMVSLALQIGDIAHVQAFAAFVRAKNPVRVGRRDGKAVSARVTVTSARMVEDLARLGVVPRKSTHEAAPDSLAFDRDFWRGAVDGDGWVKTSTRYPAVGICGSATICNQFLTFARTVTATAAKTRKVKGKKCWTTELHGAPARDVLRVLYKGCGGVALARKLESCADLVLDDPVVERRRGTKATETNDKA